MADAPGAACDSGRRLNWRWRVLVALLLAVHGALGWTAALGRSECFDEGVHLTEGYAYWTLDHRVQPENGVLPEQLAALPLLAAPPRFPDLNRPPLAGAWNYRVKDAFLYENGNDAGALLARGRLMMVLLSLCLGLLIFVWSRELFGTAGAFVSLILFSFCPGFLAQSAIIGSDLALALFLPLSAWCFWRLRRGVTWLALAVSCLACAGAVLSKMTGVLAAPVLVALAGLQLLRNEPLRVCAQGCRERQVQARGTRLALWAGILALHALAAWLLIWAAHGFRYSAFNAEALAAGARWNWQDVLLPGSAISSAVAWARDLCLLPEGFLYGFAHCHSTAQERAAFAAGQWSPVGWWWFFPYAFLVKTALGAFGVMALAAGVALRGGDRNAQARRRCRGLYEAAPLWIVLLVYGGVAVTASLNLGLRHILPLYTVIYVLCGAAGALWWRADGPVTEASPAANLSPSRRPRWAVWLLAACLAAHAVESLSVYPHSMAFFNRAAGGPAHGYRCLVDSSLDWGQELPALAARLGRISPADGPVYVAYFGAASLDYYRVPGLRLPGVFDQRRLDPARPAWLQHFALRGGWYAISATMLQQVYTPCPGPWTSVREAEYQRARLAVAPFLEAPDSARERLWAERGAAFWTPLLERHEHLRLAKLCAHLCTREPDEQVGHAILLYRVNDEELRKALE